MPQPRSNKIHLNQLLGHGVGEEALLTRCPGRSAEAFKVNLHGSTQMAKEITMQSKEER